MRFLFLAFATSVAFALFVTEVVGPLAASVFH